MGNMVPLKHQVVLVPDQMSGTENVTYIAHVVSDSGQLKPLIYNTRADGSGQMIIPSWDKSELNEYYKAQQVTVDANFALEVRKQKISEGSGLGLFSPRGRPSYRNVQQ